MMKKILANGATLFLLSLLTGCWGIPIKTSAPNEYGETKNTIVSFYGSTTGDIIEEFGEPDLVVKRNEITYFIYEWRKADRDVMFLLYLPIGIEKTKLKKYCILLEFDKNNRLIRHASARGSDNNPSLGEELGCQAVFAAQTENLRRAIRTHCHEADLGNANSQLQIADIYYLGLLNVKKDLTRAYLWYSLAYANGSEVASYRMDDIVKGMSSEQLVLAKKMVEEWEPGMCENALLEGHREFIKQ